MADVTTALPRSAVYKRIADGLGPVLADLGMQPVSRLNYPCWVMRLPDDVEQLYVCLQVDEKANDAYAGGGFRIEVEKSKATRPASGLTGRVLFFQLLNAQELAEVLTRQNQVIQALPKPPDSHVQAYPPGPVRQEYQSRFEEQTGFDTIRCWMRYRSLCDVDSWIHTLKPLMAGLVTRGAELLRQDARHLGKGSLVGN